MFDALQVRARGEIAPAAWDAFVDASDECWLWHRSDLIDALSLWPGHDDASHAVVDGNGSMLAAMPLHRTTARIAGLIPCIRYSSLGGPGCSATLSPSQRAKVLSVLHEHLLGLMSVDNAMSLDVQISALTPSLHGAAAQRVNPLVSAGFENTQTETWMVDLNGSPEDIRKRYSELTRRELRKASRSIRLREASGPKDLDIYYALHRETYARSGAAAHPIEYFKAIFEKFQPRGLARIMFAERGSDVVAAQNTARYKGGAVYWTGASISEKEGGENRVLFDEQIMAARAAGCSLYETGQAFVNSRDAKEAGLSRFKRSFGAELHPFCRGLLRSSRLSFRLLHGLREMLRKIRGAG